MVKTSGTSALLVSLTMLAGATGCAPGMVGAVGLALSFLTAGCDMAELSAESGEDRTVTSIADGTVDAWDLESDPVTGEIVVTGYDNPRTPVAEIRIGIASSGETANIRGTVFVEVPQEQAQQYLRELLAKCLAYLQQEMAGGESSAASEDGIGSSQFALTRSCRETLLWAALTVLAVGGEAVGCMPAAAASLGLSVPACLAMMNATVALTVGTGTLGGAGLTWWVDGVPLTDFLDSMMNIPKEAWNTVKNDVATCLQQ